MRIHREKFGFNSLYGSLIGRKLLNPLLVLDRALKVVPNLREVSRNVPARLISIEQEPTAIQSSISSLNFKTISGLEIAWDDIKYIASYSSPSETSGQVSRKP
jgi:hypothetical protein